jgi:DNA-binding XRE family transcriptional regulator
MQIEEQQFFKTVNDRIKEIRVLSRMTQDEFATKFCEISRSTVANMEAGRNGASLETIKALVNNLNKNKDLMRNESVAQRASYTFLFEGELGTPQTENEKILNARLKKCEETIARQNKVIDALTKG